MKFIPLIIRNVLRNKIRTLFTGSSIAMSLFLVVLLYSFLTIQDDIAASAAGYNRIVATHVNGLTGNVPIAYVDRIRALSGVRTATPFSWFGGKYREETIPFAQFGVDANYIMDLLEELKLPAEQLQAWKDDKTGCVVGSLLAKNKGWKIGDKIPLKGDIYPVDLELTVRGIYDGASTTDREQLWFHFEYMDEALKAKQQASAGNAGIVFIRAQSASAMPELMRTIDKTFANSDAPVRAMTEKEFVASFMEMIGNVQMFIRVISGAVVFALLFVAGNGMAMALRERTREIAVLKAIGFGRAKVLGLCLTESTLIALLGGLAGGLGARFMFQFVDFSRFLTGLGTFYVPWIVAFWAVVLGGCVGLVSGIIPAWRAANLSVVDGLRRVV
jgi:putative ABC transport system permease protein